LAAILVLGGGSVDTDSGEEVIEVVVVYRGARVAAARR